VAFENKNKVENLYSVEHLLKQNAMLLLMYALQDLNLNFKFDLNFFNFGALPNISHYITRRLLQ